jgi:AraC-like DNA-binding protein
VNLKEDETRLYDPEAPHRLVATSGSVLSGVHSRFQSRFQRALALANRGRRVDWTGVALDCGYFDQAHFIHDFRSFAGLTPTEYLASKTSKNHVTFLQSGPGGI